MIKHFLFNSSSGSGRVAVAIDDDKFRFAGISGPAPETWVLGAVLAEWPELLQRANEAAATRRNQYTTVNRVGMSGCLDVLLIERRNDAMADFPVRARLHVSMYDKLNEGVECWIGDLAPLLADLINRGNLKQPAPGCAVWEAQHREIADWQSGGGSLIWPLAFSFTPDTFVLLWSVEPFEQSDGSCIWLDLSQISAEKFFALPPAERQPVSHIAHGERFQVLERDDGNWDEPLGWFATSPIVAIWDRRQS